MIRLDLSDLPDEVVSYGFDQLTDRLRGQEGDNAVLQILANDLLVMDYTNKSITIKRSLVEETLLKALREKIRDIQWEINHDERDDFTLDDVDRWRDTLNEEF